MTTSSAPGRQRDGLGRQRPRIDEQRLADARQARRHLVHDADGRADEVGLDRSADPGQLHVVELESEQTPQRPEDRHFQGRARRKATTERHIGGQREIEPASLEARGAKGDRHALHVVQPPLTGLLVAELEHAQRRIGAELAAPHANATARACRHGRHGRLRDQGRQHEAAVVVGVLADEIHAPVRRRDHHRRDAEQLGELRVADHRQRAAHSRLTSTACSSRALSSGSVSAVNAPAPASLPARYFSLPGMR